MVNVTDGADVNMRLSALKLFLGHEALLLEKVAPFWSKSLLNLSGLLVSSEAAIVTW